MIAASTRREEILAAIDRHETFLAKVLYAIERGWNCPRCNKPITKPSFEEGDHPCVGITRMELGGLSDELEAIDREAANRALDAEEIKLMAVDVGQLVKLPTLEPTKYEKLEYQNDANVVPSVPRKTTKKN